MEDGGRGGQGNTGERSLLLHSWAKTREKTSEGEKTDDGGMRGDDRR